MDAHDLASLIPMAVGMIISPLPIVAIVAILLSSRGRSAAPAYTGAFVLVSIAFVGIGAATAAGAAASGSTGAAKVVALVLTIALTIGFTGLAIASWVTRPQHGATPKAPSWLAAIDTIDPLRAAGLGFVMAVTNSKNIPLEIKGGAIIGAAHLPLLATVGICVAFAVAGALALIVPTVIAAGGSASVARVLGRLKSDMIAHNAVIMTVLFSILAANEAAHLVRALFV